MPVPPYDEAGRGPAIVFRHGTMMDRSMFRPQFAALSRSLRVIAFDHRARTARWRGPYSLDDLASGSRAFLDALGIERCVLGGMSMGGFMALRLALRHPERLNGMILIDSMASAPLSPNGRYFHSLKDTGPLSEAVAQRNSDILFGVTTRSHRPELVEAWKAWWRELTGASVYWETASWLRREDLSLATRRNLCPHARDPRRGGRRRSDHGRRGDGRWRPERPLGPRRKRRPHLELGGPRCRQRGDKRLRRIAATRLMTFTEPQHRETQGATSPTDCLRCVSDAGLASNAGRP